MTELHPLPPVTADGRTTLEQFLDYFRSVLVRKADGIDEAQARQQVGVSAMDMLGLVRHMALVEQWWFSQAFAGSTEPDLWEDPDDHDADWHHSPADTLAGSPTAKQWYLVEWHDLARLSALKANGDAPTASESTSWTRIKTIFR